MTHQEKYPKQYSHALYGTMVRVVTHKGQLQKTGVVERVVQSRFGMLAILQGKDETGWRVQDCKPVKTLS